MIVLALVLMAMSVYAITGITKSYDINTNTITASLFGVPRINFTLVNQRADLTRYEADMKVKPFFSLNLSVGSSDYGFHLTNKTARIEEKIINSTGFVINEFYAVEDSRNNLTCSIITEIHNATNMSKEICTNNWYLVNVTKIRQRPFNFFNFNYAANAEYNLTLIINTRAETGYRAFDWILKFLGLEFTEWAVYSSNWTNSSSDNVSLNFTGTLDRFVYSINGTKGLWFNSLNQSTGGGGIQGNCADLRSVNPEGTLSNNITIEICNTTTIVAHTSGNLNGSANSSINNSIYYGNLTVAGERSHAAIFDDNYTFVMLASNITDFSRYGNNGTVTGTVDWNTSCVFGNCTSFTADASYIGYGNPTIFTYRQGFTAEFWMTVRSWGGGQTPFGKHDGGVNSDKVFVFYSPNANSIDCIISTSVTADVEANGDGSAISTNAWHHYVCSYDGAAMRLYIDGQLINATALTGDMNTGNAVLSIGDTFEGSGIPPRGSLDHIMISNVNRTPSYIYNRYIDGRDGVSKINVQLAGAADTTPPTNIIDNPTNRTYINSNITLNVRCGDNNGVSEGYYSINNGVNTSIGVCGNTTIIAVNGTNTFKFTVNDTSNTTNTTNVNFSLNMTPPVINYISLTAGNNTIINSSSSFFVNFSVEPTGGLDVVDVNRFEWNNTNITLDASGLVLDIHFGENGTSIRDLSRYTNNATASGTTGTFINECRFPPCWKFDAAGDRFQVPLSASVNSTNSTFTIEMWLNVSSIQTDVGDGIGRIVSLQTEVADGDVLVLEVNITGTGIRGSVNGVNTAYVNITPNSTFNHIIFSYDNSSMRIYVNGILGASTSRNGTYTLDNRNSLWFGGTYGSGDFLFTGSVDELKIWNTNLSLAEIRTISNYNISRGRFFANATIPTSGAYRYKGWINNSNGVNDTVLRTITLDAGPVIDRLNLSITNVGGALQNLTFNATFSDILTNVKDFSFGVVNYTRRVFSNTTLYIEIINLSLPINDVLTVNDTADFNGSYPIRFTFWNTSHIANNSALNSLNLSYQLTTFNVSMQWNATQRLVNLTYNVTYPPNSTNLINGINTIINLNSTDTRTVEFSGDWLFEVISSEIQDT